jgi:hypothetical protein
MLPRMQQNQMPCQACTGSSVRHAYLANGTKLLTTECATAVGVPGRKG